MIPAASSSLTTDCVLNALESLGLYSDGRLLALNSYENRVYQGRHGAGRGLRLLLHRSGERGR